MRALTISHANINKRNDTHADGNAIHHKTGGDETGSNAQRAAAAREMRDRQQPREPCGEP
jgi:hypothetical protein